MENDVFNGLGIQVILENPDDFLKVKETLTRIGVPSLKEGKQTLFQSCHILHKRGKYAIMHYKELFILDGKPSTLSEQDTARRDVIVKLLENWGLLKIAHPMEKPTNAPPIRIIPYKERLNWALTPKYTIGKFSLNPERN